MQRIILDGEFAQKISVATKAVSAERYLLVCDSSFSFLPIEEYFNTEAKFYEFTPNPLYEQVCNGIELFNEKQCDCIVAVGGGSTIDVAKCIKLFCRMNPSENYLQQEYRDSGVPLIAIPTTAGTGSESTQHAVIYYNGQKQSISHPSIVPDYAILEPSVLKTLPLYQKKCTMLDALCQGIESWWSVNSNDESKSYSKFAVETIIRNIDTYINANSDKAAEQIMLAANYAGRAINITQTTAPHAMSYKLTSMYNLPHGHAVAICLPGIWDYMLNNVELCSDTRGSEYLCSTFYDISRAMCCNSPKEATSLFVSIINKLEISGPTSRCREDDIETLTKSVNRMRLKNNPLLMNSEVIKELYERIVK